jgi:hypothetical protein
LLRDGRKLEWSKGVSRLQLRDCRNLIALNRERIDLAVRRAMG